MGSTPSLLQVNVLFFAVDLIQMNSKNKTNKKNIALKDLLDLSLFPFAPKQYSTDEIIFPRCTEGF